MFHVDGSKLLIHYAVVQFKNYYYVIVLYFISSIFVNYIILIFLCPLFRTKIAYKHYKHILKRSTTN